MKFTVEEFLNRLPLPADEKWKDVVCDVEALRKKNVSLVLFAPRGTDYQNIHDEDEFYFILRGSGELTVDDKTFSFETGDAFLFPPKFRIILKNLLAILQLGRFSFEEISCKVGKPAKKKFII